MEIDKEQRERLDKELGIPDEKTYLEVGREAPCRFCGGPHWLVHCPGGVWVHTPAGRDKAGSTVAESTRLKYDARRAAMQQRNLLIMAGQSDSALYDIAANAEHVPISRLAAVMGMDMDRMCALCDVTADDDVDLLSERLPGVMQDSFLQGASAAARAAL